MDREHQKLREILGQFTTAMLVTRAPDGLLQARPMHIATAEGEADLWFVASVDSSKVEEVCFDPHVAVTCQADQRFLTVGGMATLESDSARARALWKEGWRPWFPAGPEDPSLILIHVRPTKAEYWDQAGINGLKLFFESARALIAGELPRGSIERHGQVEF